MSTLSDDENSNLALPTHTIHGLRVITDESEPGSGTDKKTQRMRRLRTIRRPSGLTVSTGSSNMTNNASPPLFRHFSAGSAYKSEDDAETSSPGTMKRGPTRSGSPLWTRKSKRSGGVLNPDIDYTSPIRTPTSPCSPFGDGRTDTDSESGLSKMIASIDRLCRSPKSTSMQERSAGRGSDDECHADDDTDIEGESEAEKDDDDDVEICSDSGSVSAGSHTQKLISHDH